MKWLGYALAALMVLTGVVWLLQGVGLLPGSFMTGQPEWAVAGAISIVVGAAVLWLTSRKGAGEESGGRAQPEPPEPGSDDS